MNNIDSHIADKVIELRKGKQLTQDELSFMLGLSRIAVNNMEKKRQSFTVKNLYLLACIFNKEVGFFFPKIKPVKFTKRKRKVEKVVIEKMDLKVGKLPVIKSW